MQVAAGVQCHRGLVAADLYVGHHILQAMGDGQLMVFAEGLP